MQRQMQEYEHIMPLLGLDGSTHIYKIHATHPRIQNPRRFTIQCRPIVGGTMDMNGVGQGWGTAPREFGSRKS